MCLLWAGGGGHRRECREFFGMSTVNLGTRSYYSHAFTSTTYPQTAITGKRQLQRRGAAGVKLTLRALSLAIVNSCLRRCLYPISCYKVVDVNDEVDAT